MRRTITLAAAVLAAVVLAPTPAAADTGDELAGCPSYSATSMPFGSVWAGPYRTVPFSSACEDINVRVASTSGSGLYSRAEYAGAPAGWTYVHTGTVTVVAANVPNGTRYRVLFTRQAVFSAYH